MAKKNQDNTQQDAGTELALFPKLNLPSVTGITEEMSKSFGTMYTRIEAGIAELPTDMSIEANRRKVASYAYSISRTKTGLDEAAAGVSGDAKLIVDAVNKERKELKTTLDTLRDKAREKLDAWEAEQKAKQDRTAEAMMDISGELIACNHQNSTWISDTIIEIEAQVYCEAIFGVDGVEKLETRRAEVLEQMRIIQARIAKEESDAAELEQLRREKAQREEAEQIRREKEEAEAAAQKAEEERKAAAEAEAARQETERARIAKEAEEKAKRDAAEAIEREKREKEAAEQRAKEAEEREAKRIEDDKRREAEQEEARAAAAARAEEDAKRREEAAKEAERQRIANEQAAKEQADAERAADIAHRKRINAAAVAGLVKVCGITEAEAKAVIVAIYKEQVPHVSINY